MHKKHKNTPPRLNFNLKPKRLRIYVYYCFPSLRLTLLLLHTLSHTPRAHAREKFSYINCLFFWRKTLNYAFAGQAFRGYTLWFVVFVQIPKIVNTGRTMMDSRFLRKILSHGLLLQFLRLSYAMSENFSSCPNKTDWRDRPDETSRV